MMDYRLMMKDIEIDIKILDDLIDDVEYYREIYEKDTDDPHIHAMHRENLQFAIDQFKSHRSYLLPRMEEWMEITLLCQDFPVSINFYRILKELRNQENLGL